MIHVIASIQVKGGSRDAFLDILKANISNVQTETGCIEYQPAVDKDAHLASQSLDTDRVMVIEKWESLEALHAHLDSSHMHTYREQVADMVEGVTLQVLEEA